MADQPITLDDVKRLDVQPGDTIAIRSDRELTARERGYLLDEFERLGSDLGVRLLLLDGGLSVDSVISGLPEPERKTA